MSESIRVRCKAFGRVEWHRVIVDPDTVLPLTGEVVAGLVRVWDCVAGYYTSCHSLSDAAKRRIRHLWADVQSIR